MYGDEAIVPLELDVPSLRISLQGDILDEEDRQQRLQQLKLLDEKGIKVFMCWPPAMEEALAGKSCVLEKLGIAKKEIHRF